MNTTHTPAPATETTPSTRATDAHAAGTRTADTAHPTAQHPTEDRSLLVDLTAITPAHTMGRELLCAVICLVIVAALLFVIAPELTLALLAFGIVAAVLAGRFAWGAVRYGWFSSDR